MVFLEGISSMEEDGYSLRTRRNECVGIEYRMVFAIVGGGIYDGFFQFTRGDGSACGVLYMGVYRIRGTFCRHHRHRRRGRGRPSTAAGRGRSSACWTFGAGMVYTAKSFSRRTLDVMLGFAAGVMIAASYWSLLAPALEMSSHLGRLACVPVALGFLAGAGVLRLVDLILPHIHPTENVPDGPPSKLPRSALLVFAITLHNIPEGLAVGVAFGAAASGAPEASIAGAMTLMFGMGLQNIPEGVAVSVPLLREGFSKNRAFFFGQLSGIVEPIAAVFGALVVGIAEPILPFALAFAAGAMIFVVVEEVIPESHASGHGDAASLGVIIGFVVMMCLDVALA